MSDQTSHCSYDCPFSHSHTHTCVCIYVFVSQDWKFDCLFTVSEVLPWVCSVYWELWEMRGGTGVGNCSWRRGRGCSLNTQSSCFGLLLGPENAALPSLHHSQRSQVPPPHMLTLLTHLSACKSSSHSNICLLGSQTIGGRQDTVMESLSGLVQRS